MLKSKLSHVLLILFVVLLIPALTVSAGRIELPRTGTSITTKCYDTGGTIIDCYETGQDGDIRAGIPWPSQRFTVTGCDNKCLRDNFTEMMWGRPHSVEMTWEEAIVFANDLNFCCYEDWRLPNINELESLVNYNVPVPAAWLNTQGFTDVQSDFYWSSTTSAYDISTAWAVSMANGWMITGNKERSNPIGQNTFYVLPVRGGQ